MYESWEDCAIREVKEETSKPEDYSQSLHLRVVSSHQRASFCRSDLDISKPTFAHVTNDPMEEEGKHLYELACRIPVGHDGPADCADYLT